MNKTGQVTHIVKTTLQLSDHRKEEVIWVTDIGEEDFVIGLTWLKRWNPKINWKTGKMTMPKSGKLRAKTTKSQEIAEEALRKDKEETFEEKFPASFKEFKPLFDEQKAQRFPPTRPYDHAIELKPD